MVRAGERGFHVSVMLFNGWSIHNKGEGNPWDRHPFNRENNLHRIDGDPDARGEGSDVHTLRVPAITRLQEAYVDKVVATVGDLDHVLWEISNESPRESVAWQYHFIHYLRAIDPHRHPIGMTATFPGNRNEDLFREPRRLDLPRQQGGLAQESAPGGRPEGGDRGHRSPLGDRRRRGVGAEGLPAGHHLAYMDPLDDDPVREAARRAIGSGNRESLSATSRTFRPEGDPAIGL